MTTNGYRQKRFARDPSLSIQEVIDEFMLIPPDQTDLANNVFVMNKIAGLIWQWLDGHRRVCEISELIAQEFDVSVEVAEADLVAFLKQLEQLGAVWPVQMDAE